jgi:hypothetical protein
MKVFIGDWKVRATIYRMLVIAQTLGWAVVSLARTIRRPPPPPLATERIAVALALVSIVGIAVGLVAFYRRRTKARDRDAVVRAWVCFQGAGFLALTGYASAGKALCFVVGILTLGVMHAFSPNRFEARTDT